MNEVANGSISRLGQVELESQARQGDKRAAARLLEQAREELVRFCYRYLGNVHEAEDTVQDVLAGMMGRAWPSESYRTHLFRTARNRCLDLWKRRQGGRMGSFFADSCVPSPRTGPETAAVRQDEGEHLRRHLAVLSRDLAEIVTLRYLDGMSRREIAEVLELPASLVKSRLREAMKALDRLVRGVGA